MGSLHAAKLTALKGIEFTGCYDSVAERAEKTAKRYGCRVYDSAAALATDINAALVAVPTKNHLECARPFLENGIAVLLEKPIAADITTAEEIVAIARENNAVLQIGHSERFNPMRGRWTTGIPGNRLSYGTTNHYRFQTIAP